MKCKYCNAVLLIEMDDLIEHICCNCIEEKERWGRLRDNATNK